MNFSKPLRARMPRRLFLGVPGEQRLADAGGVHGRAGAGREEGADRLVGFDLGDEEHLVLDLDPQVRGLAGFAHQRVHRLAGAFDDLGAAQEGRADAEGARADVPELAGLVDLSTMPWPAG